MADTEAPTPEPLAGRLIPPGPVVAEGPAERLHETLQAAADADGWGDVVDRAWPALGPIAAASPYLAGLMRRRPAHLRQMLEVDPEASLKRILRDTAALDGVSDDVRAPLRVLKADLHLL